MEGEIIAIVSNGRLIAECKIETFFILPMPNVQSPKKIDVGNFKLWDYRYEMGISRFSGFQNFGYVLSTGIFGKVDFGAD